MPRIEKSLRIENNNSNKKIIFTQKILLQLILTTMLKFNFNSKQEIINSAKSAFSINFPFYVFALGILLAFSAFQCEGCEEGYEDPLYCGVGECEVINVAEVTEVTQMFFVLSNLGLN